MKSYMRYKTITVSVYDCNGEIIFHSDNAPINVNPVGGGGGMAGKGGGFEKF